MTHTFTNTRKKIDMQFFEHFFSIILLILLLFLPAMLKVSSYSAIDVTVHLVYIVVLILVVTGISLIVNMQESEIKEHDSL